MACEIRFVLDDAAKNVEVSKCEKCGWVWLGKISNKRCPRPDEAGGACAGNIFQKTGVNQTEVSILTGISRPNISQLFNNPGSVFMKTLGKLCEGLGVDPSQLFEAEES